MKPSHIRPLVAALLAVAAGPACGSAGGQSTQASPQPAQAEQQGDAAAIARAQADSARRPWTAADAKFMTHMIGHHAQAIVMANWAPTHDASPAIRILAARIINAQQDEIATMQRWLRDRRQPVPEAVPGVKMVMDGVEHVMLMPGMLTEAQMAELDRARGKEFDRLFLTYMIQHHRGATAMVSELFGSYGAGQDETIFKFASDVNVDQTTEIERMQRMLADLVLGGGSQ
jgi:uncharacterized protein (DUF305 family)